MVADTPEQPQGAGAIVPVGQAQSSASAYLPAADLEGIKQIATQTRAIGIIMPPPDIRAIVDKTAQFVAKNGTCCI
jgi:splicing factor 3A subunit 1